MNSEKPAIETFYIIAAVFAGLLLGGYFLRHTFSALLTALAIAYLLNPLLKYLEKQGFDRLTALILLYGIAAFAWLLASFLFIPYLIHQSDTLVNSFPRYVQNFKTALESWKLRMAPYYAGEEGAWLIEQAEESFTWVTHELSGTSFRQIKGLFFGIFDLVLAPILVFLILYYKEFFKVLTKRMMPFSERHNLTELGKKINRSLERYILGMLLDCLMVGMLTSAVLYFLDIEFPLLNGLFTGFTTIVPYLGVIVAIIPAAFIGYAKNGDPTIIPKVCIAYFFIHVIFEGNLIKPLVMKRTLKLNPLAAIFSIMALGELLGFWGIILAVPLAAVVKICATELKELIVGPKAQKSRQ